MSFKRWIESRGMHLTAAVAIHQKDIDNEKITIDMFPDNIDKNLIPAQRFFH
jgi:hypothetical protein